MSVINLLYALAVIFIVIVIAFHFIFLKKMPNHYAIYLLASAVVANFGYLWFTSSKNLSEALISMRVVYLGNIPLLYFCFLVIADICKVKLHGIIRVFLGVTTIVTIYLSSTIGNSTIFYTDATYLTENGYSYLEKVYGPAHSAYICIILGYMIASMGIAIYALFRPATVPRGMAFSLAMTEFLCALVYFGERFIGLKYEVLPFAYCISIAIISYILIKQYLYDADRVAISVRESNQDNAVILFDKNKRYLGSNAVAKKLFNEIERYYVEQPISNDFTYKQYFEGIINLFEDKGSTELSELFEKDGKIYGIHVKRLINETVRGDRGYIIEFVDDTTNQNYIKKISDMNEELANAVDAANAANTAKSNFLASMSHEIRTPINAVLGLNSIILRDSLEDTTKEYAKDIDSAGKALLSLINDILDFSKVEAGRMDIVPVEYKLNSFIADCRNMMYSRFSDKNLAFEINCDEGAPSVYYGDEVRIRQIVINLLTNAFKYTEEGSVTFDIKYSRIDDSHVNLIFSVKDTGKGISIEDQKDLFESFKRIDEVKNRNIEGTGLGLALVKNITDLLGGVITVDSVLNEGSTFTVEIPQKVVSYTPIGMLAKSSDDSSSDVKMDGLSEVKGDVLVVDDVALNIKVIKMLLKKSKLTVDTADSGMMALEMAKAKKYDIIFLDHMMPVMDGIETFHRLRDDENSKSMNSPVVMLTANAIEGIKEKYMDEGFDDYLSKPVNFAALEKVVLKYI